MPVAESMHIQDISVGGCKEEVLRERKEHMPRVKEKKGRCKIDTKNGCAGKLNGQSTNRCIKHLNIITRRPSFTARFTTKGNDKQIEQIQCKVELHKGKK